MCLCSIAVVTLSTSVKIAAVLLQTALKPLSGIDYSTSSNTYNTGSLCSTQTLKLEENNKTGQGQRKSEYDQVKCRFQYTSPSIQTSLVHKVAPSETTLAHYSSPARKSNAYASSILFLFEQHLHLIIVDRPSVWCSLSLSLLSPSPEHTTPRRRIPPKVSAPRTHLHRLVCKGDALLAGRFI